MIVIDNEIYLERANSYVKCDLMVNSAGAYYLKETDRVIRRLSGGFESLTWGELLARYRELAIEDHDKTPVSEVATATKPQSATVSAARRPRKEA